MIHKNRAPRKTAQGIYRAESLEARRLLADAANAAIERFETSPRVFVQNAGQWKDPSVRFIHQGKGAKIALTDAGPVFELYRDITPIGPHRENPDAPLAASRGSDLQSLENRQFDSKRFSVNFVNANATTPVGHDRTGGVFNYYVGDPSQHRSNVAGFEKVVYPSLYNGIDLHTWGQRDSLKYEFHVAPGSDHTQIALRYAGIEDLWIDRKGRLNAELGAGFGRVVDDAPVIYQMINGRRVDVAGRFVLLDETSYAFELTGGVDPRVALVIDPDLVWSSYLGGSGMESAAGVGVDSDGNVLVGGSSESFLWSSSHPASDSNNLFDMYVVKMSSHGLHMWTSFVGTEYSDAGYGLAVSRSGKVAIGGGTSSFQFDSLAALLGSNGQQLWTRTFNLVPGAEIVRALAFDSLDRLWIAGTSHPWSPATNFGWIVKLSQNGDQLLRIETSSVNFGELTGLAADYEGNIAAVGRTGPTDWIVGGYDDTYNGGPDDGFVAKFNNAGQHVWSTYIGGDDQDYPWKAAFDSNGNLLVAGLTQSAGWVRAGFDITKDDHFGSDFVVKIDPDGGHLWSTYVNARPIGSYYANGLATDSHGSVFVVGSVTDADWANGGFDTSLSDTDAYVLKITSTGQHAWSSYLGGEYFEEAFGVARSPQGELLVIGDTGSPDWIAGGFDVTLNGGDGFVAKIRDTPAVYTNSDLIVSAVSFSPASVQVGQPLNATFTIQNIGVAAAGPSKARVRLSVDQTLTLYDYPMAPLDVDVPFIPAGQSWSFTGPLTIPPGTPAGQYYLGVFADALNAAGQTNVTNDAGLSAGRVTVTAGIGVAPVITQEPQAPASSPLAGDTVRLTVAATGTALQYQWFRDTQQLHSSFNGPELVLRNISVRQSGTYRVRVYNAVDEVNSVNVSFSVLPGPTEPQLAGFGQLRSLGGAFVPTSPTVVLTHGWQPVLSGPGPASDSVATPEWVESMAASIAFRMTSLFQHVNIFAFVWPGGFTQQGVSNLLRFFDASVYAEMSGEQLARSLKNALGTGYNEPLHLIGHSLGTVVNANAVHHLPRINSGIDVEQFTMLDPPMKFRVSGPLFSLLVPHAATAQFIAWTQEGIALFDEDYFHDRLLGSSQPNGVDFVDLYYGTRPASSGTATPGFGRPIDGAAPAGGKRLPDADHVQVHQFYAATIPASNTAIDGFDFSVVLGSARSPLPAPSVWNPPPPDGPSILDPLPSELQDALNAINGWIISGGNVITSTFNNGVQTIRGLLFGGSGGLDETSRAVSVSEAVLDLTIPTDATHLTVDTKIDGGVDAALSFYFNDALLHVQPGESTGAATFSTLSISVAALAGESGVLRIVYATPDSSTAAVGRIAFVDAQGPVAESGFEYESQQAVLLRFSEDVGNTLVSNDVAIVNVTSSTTVTAGTLAYDAATRQATLTFAATLPDGDYRATLPASAVSDGTGNVNETPFTLDFFILTADATRDRTVNIDDFGRLAPNFNFPATFSQGDFDYSGTANIDDFGLLAARFNTSLPLPAGDEGPAAGRLVGGGGADEGVGAGRVLPAGGSRFSGRRVIDLVEEADGPAPSEAEGLPA